MEYQVTVNRIKYLVTISPSSCDENLHEKADAITYETAKAEYEHTIHRLDRLDNKVYILLTACAFLFSMVSSALQENKLALLPKTVQETLLLASFLSFLLLLIILVSLLGSVKLKRFNISMVNEHDMIYADKMHATKYICLNYLKCTSHNNDLLEKRYRRYNICVILMIINIAALLSLAVIK